MLQIVCDFFRQVAKPDDQYELVGPIIRDRKNAKVTDVGSPNDFMYYFSALSFELYSKNWLADLPH